MSTMQTEHQADRDLRSLFHSTSRSPEIPESSDVYGWLIGSWNFDVLYYRAVDLSSQNITGEIHFGWILEGRAIQDVWIMPGVSTRQPDSDRVNNMYGTTLRIWDPSMQAWRIRWINPISGHEERQTGRKIGNEIVQIGTRIDGTPTRWRFIDITPQSFRWIGEVLEPDGKTWKIEGEFQARRS